MPQQVLASIAWTQIVERQTGLFTRSQNEILRSTRVLLLGAGGMGMNVASHLARAGFEHFTLLDFDVVDGTSANRTPFSYDDTLGMQKVEATKKYLLKINRSVRIEALPHVKFDLRSDPAFMAKLVENHDVLSWAIDGMAARIYFTRITHEVGRNCKHGKPAVESWGPPFLMCYWTVPNAPGSLKWEDYFALPTADMDIADITKEDVTAMSKAFLKGLSGIPHLLETLDPALMRKWLNLEISNRTLGSIIVGSSTLIALEIIKNALQIGGEPLAYSQVHNAPWLVLYDTRRNVAYEYNFMTHQARWRHPLTGELTYQ